MAKWESASNEAVAGEMLADVGHAGAAQAGNQGTGECRHRGGIRWKARLPIISLVP
jgi:hypothetical protein